MDQIPNDCELMAQISSGDQAAFGVLVRRHTQKFYALAYRMLSNKAQAEDVVQDCFLKIWKNPSLWDPNRKAKFTTWFYRMVVNLSLDYNKKKKATGMPENYEVADTANQSEDLIRKEQKEMLEKSLEELPERQRIAINLCFYESVSNKEAAEILDINIKALESLLMRAKTTLKKKFRNYDEVNI